MSGTLRGQGAWARVLWAALVVVVAGCAADKPKPADLQPLAPQIAGRQVWTAQLGEG